MPLVDATFYWILGGGLLMGAIAMVGSLTLVLSERALERLLLPLVALAAGSLMGGAVFHLLPEAVDEMGNTPRVYAWFVAGFSAFLLLEQLLHLHHRHHHHRARQLLQRRPLGYLVLLADGVHNFIGGLAVAGAFLISIPVGISTWIAAAAHEVPQELGDFGILVHSGWTRASALAYNVLSALTFLVGGLAAYVASFRLDVTFLAPFAAGNFVYIAAADLIPEINRPQGWRSNLLHLGVFVLGLALLFSVRVAFGG